MKVRECNNFSADFPETFTWGHVNQISLSNLANTISNHIWLESKNKRGEERILTPGLREALNQIADIADV